MHARTHTHTSLEFAEIAFYVLCYIPLHYTVCIVTIQKCQYVRRFLMFDFSVFSAKWLTGQKWNLLFIFLFLLLKSNVRRSNSFLIILFCLRHDSKIIHWWKYELDRFCLTQVVWVTILFSFVVVDCFTFRTNRADMHYYNMLTNVCTDLVCYVLLLL